MAVLAHHLAHGLMGAAAVATLVYTVRWEVLARREHAAGRRRRRRA